MPFAYEKVSNLFLAGEAFTPKPYISGWNRVEGRVRVEEFERALRAEARDPLFFLTRQWQFLELKADDAGSPIEARMALRRTRLERFASVNGPAQPFPTDAPLEAVVEREAPPFDRVAHIQAHRAFDKALIAEGIADPSSRRKAHTFMRAEFPLDAARIAGVPDAEADQLALLSNAHLFDTAAFLAAADFDARVAARLAPSEPALAPAVTKAGTAAKAWYRALYLAPQSAGDSAWAPGQLEYQFQCATAPAEGQTVLTGDSYTQGRLDWYCVDVAEPSVRLGDASETPAASPEEETLSFIPAAITFAGMPSHRFWEMENSKVEFGAISTHTTDVGKLLLMEFMLAYGNDWCVTPYEAEVGSLLDVLGVVVLDVFGEATLIRAADRGTDEDWRRWALFGLETQQANDRAQPRLFLPPTTPKLMESAPIERVVFLRDEMANMCWGVERTVPSAAGIGVDGEQYALSIAAPAVPAPIPAEGTTARYRLGTDAPLNWRPFVPVHLPGSTRGVRLQRARLPHGTRRPLGAILSEPSAFFLAEMAAAPADPNVPAPPAYFIDEEAVPRAGRIVTRSFQRTRWIDGRVVLWLGRRSLVGRGEGSSGLAFDVLEEIGARS